MVNLPLYDGDYIIIPMKYTIKTIVKHVWEVDNSVKFKVMKHPFDEERCARRLLWEYQNYDRLIVGVDFDNTIKTIKPDSSCDELIDLLRRCSEDPKIVLCLWTISENQQELKEKYDYCKSLGIQLDFINDSPFLAELGGNKKFFNVLLDDRAGLESAYNNLKYVLDNK